MSEQRENLQQSFSIGELSERTQMNTVTLRAWERRYGLLKPMRTASGHRLYTEDDVRRVARINAWIARGVPVSKVKRLLENPRSETAADAVGDERPWLDLQNELLAALRAGQENRLYSLLRQALLDYPPMVYGERVMTPVMRQLQTPEGMGMAFSLQNRLLAYVQNRLEQKGSDRRKRQPVQLIAGMGSPLWPLGLLALQIQDAGQPVVLFGLPCDRPVWLRLVEDNPERTTIVYQDGRWTPAEQHAIGERLARFPRLMLCGSAPMLAGLESAAGIFACPQDSAEALLARLTRSET